MTQQEIEQFASMLENVQREENMGYIFFFVGDVHYFPFVSIATRDVEGDSVSNLSRGGLFRVNIGISKQSFTSLFGEYPAPTLDYTVIDTFLPHPHYAKQFYLCIINPSNDKDEVLQKYIREAHAIATARLPQTN